jgi:flavin reductase (DIM6/NTAB) family NADH-FMN oxidoreductase RutF
VRQAVLLDKAYRLINHGPVVLVSAAHGEEKNVMAAAWCMAIDFLPPKLAVVISQDAYTRQLVDASQQLVVQVPPRAMLEVVDGVGNCSGRDVDKWSRFSLRTEPASKVSAPLIVGCTAWLECQVIPGEDGVRDRYDLILCEIVAAWADDAVFDNGRLRPDVAEPARALHHVAGGVYLSDGPQLKAR